MNASKELIEMSLPLIHVNKTNSGIRNFLRRYYGNLDSIQANSDLADGAGFAHWSIGDADWANPGASWIELAIAATRRLTYEAIPVTHWWTMLLCEPAALDLGDVKIQLLYGQRESHRQVVDLEPCFFCFYAERQQVQVAFTWRLDPSGFEGGIDIYAPADSAHELDPRWGLSMSPSIILPEMGEDDDLDYQPEPQPHGGPKQPDVL